MKQLNNIVSYKNTKNQLVKIGIFVCSYSWKGRGDKKFADPYKGSTIIWLVQFHIKF